MKLSLSAFIFHCHVPLKSPLPVLYLVIGHDVYIYCLFWSPRCLGTNLQCSSLYTQQYTFFIECNEVFRNACHIQSNWAVRTEPMYASADSVRCVNMTISIRPVVLWPHLCVMKTSGNSFMNGNEMQFDVESFVFVLPNCNRFIKQYRGRFGLSSSSQYCHWYKVYIHGLRFNGSSPRMKLSKLVLQYKTLSAILGIILNIIPIGSSPIRTTSGNIVSEISASLVTVHNFDNLKRLMQHFPWPFNWSSRIIFEVI